MSSINHSLWSFHYYYLVGDFMWRFFFLRSIQKYMFRYMFFENGKCLRCQARNLGLTPFRKWGQDVIRTRKNFAPICSGVLFTGVEILQYSDLESHPITKSNEKSINIIKWCSEHGFSLFTFSLANCSYHPSLPPGLLVSILCPYRVVVSMFFLVVQHCHVHVKGSMGERHRWFRSYYFSSVL